MKKHNDSTLWDSAKAGPRGKFIAIQSYLRKQSTKFKDNL